MWLSCCGKRDVQFRNGNALCTPLDVWWGFDPARPILLKQNIEQLYRRVWRRGDTELETWSWGGNFTNNKRLRCEGQREGDREATPSPLLRWTSAPLQVRGTFQLVFCRKRDDFGNLSEQPDTLDNLVPVPSCREDILHVGEYMKNRKCYKKDVVVAGGERLKAH